MWSLPSTGNFIFYVSSELSHQARSLFWSRCLIIHKRSCLFLAEEVLPLLAFHIVHRIQAGRVEQHGPCLPPSSLGVGEQRRRSECRVEVGSLLFGGVCACVAAKGLFFVRNRKRSH